MDYKVRVPGERRDSEDRAQSPTNNRGSGSGANEDRAQSPTKRRGSGSEANEDGSQSPTKRRRSDGEEHETVCPDQFVQRCAEM